MKHRRDDKRRQSRARDGDSQTRDADAVRARQTPGERVSRAYERVKGRAQRDESHIQRDESRTRRDELHIRRDKPHIQRDEPHIRHDESRVRRDDGSIRRNEPRAGRDVHDIRHEESRARRDERGGGAEISGARDDAARRTRTEEDGAHVFGVQPVLEALRAGARPVERLTVAEGAHESRLREILEIARYADIPVRRVPRAELQRLAAGANHQGVVATIAAAHYTHAEDLLDALAARVGTNDPPLAVVLDGVEDPRNLGAVIRTMECAGAHGAFIPERRASGLTETVAKAAAGALEYVPVARAANVVRLIEELKGRGVWTVGAAADASKDYTEWDWTQPSAILLGGEGEGLRRLVRERCDVLVRVPLLGRIESLNVSVAAGIILYEAVRQRRIKKVMSDE
jgi:23S rRNA (guanosine2251-2'-O)-methyltransferase